MRSTTSPFLTRALFSLAAIIALAIAPSRVHAQAESPADLRRENDTLRNRVAQLEAANTKLEDESDRLRKRVSQLESQLARLQAENTKLRNPETSKPGDTPAGPTSTGGQPQSNLPADPLACPPSLLSALKAKYQEEFAKRTITDQNRADYIKDVRRWALEMKREFKDRVTWTVEIKPADVPGDERLPVKLRVVDPDTHEPYHTDPVAIDLGARNTRRVMLEPDKNLWVLEGVFFADPDVNSSRETEGTLNYPPLIGPFAEFKFGLSVRSIVPAEIKPTP